MDQLAELLEVFTAEAEEQIDEIGRQIDALRACPESHLDEVLTVLTRTTHNLKGGASCVGEDVLAKTCHAIEELLQPFRAERTRPPAPILETLLEHVTQIQRRIRTVAEETETGLDRAEAGQDLPVGSRDRAGGSTTIRVQTTRLDSLMASIRELHVAHARLLSRNERWAALAQGLDTSLEHAATPTDPESDWRAQLQRLLGEDRRDTRQFGHLTSRIGEAMRKLRMLPLEQHAVAWRSTVREAALELSRQVSVDVQVGGIEIDRYLLEQLRDPMIHLLRNCVSHGIELPEDRIAVGKDPQGRILVRAEMAGRMIQLEVSDDGRGLDLGRLKEIAVRRGFLDAEAAHHLTAEEAQLLIFAPGFSSTEDVDRISGRGIGLSVVRSNVEALGGFVQVSPHPRLGGTSFLLHLPASLLTTNCLLVAADGALYALPSHAITRVLAARREHLLRLDSSPTLQLPGEEPVHLGFLANLMGLSPCEPGERLTLVLLEQGGRQLALVVDDIVGERELVSQPLPPKLGRVKGISGAAVQDDGSLALVLDVGALFDLDRMPRSARGPIARASATSGAARILVVDDALTSRMLMHNMLTASGYVVSVATDGEEAWRLLDKERFDVVVSDVQMPRLDGFALTRRIRARASLRDLPVILVTQLEQPEDLARGREAGADEYLVKGQFSQRLLLEALGRLLMRDA